MPNWPGNIRPHNQRVWVKSHRRVGYVIGKTMDGRKVKTYTVVLSGPDASVSHEKPTDLLTAEKWCDSCERCLPRSSFNGGGQVHNPIDGEVELEVCFLCKREARKYSY